MDGKGYRLNLPVGAVIFHEGEAGDNAYIINSGQVGVSTRINDQDIQFAISTHGDILGEMALIDDGFRTATATVLEEAELIVIPKSYIKRLLASSDPTVDLLIKIVLNRYREMKSHLELIASGGELDRLEVSSCRDTNQLLEQTQNAVNRVTQEQRLQQAIDNQELTLYYQPIIDLKNDRIAGCEALIRWIDPEQGMIPPIQFIALAEETGLIEPIGHWIFETANNAALRFNQLTQSDQTLFVSINLSSRQIETDLQVAELFSFLLQNQVNMSRLKIEITETLLMSNPVKVCDVLRDFKRLGSQIALDDFGTGYSSFSYLHRFPIDNIKIDRSFVATMSDNPKSCAIVRTLCQLAESLEMSTIAEGVETVEDADRLKSFGCTFGQGYYYAKPLPEEDFIALLENPAPDWKQSDE